MAVKQIERITNQNSRILSVEEFVDGLRDMMKDLDAFTLATKVINGTEATVFTDEGQEIVYKPVPVPYEADGCPVRYCDPNNEFIGSKSQTETGRVYAKEAAKGIRADVKEAKKLGYLPKDLKLSVRCRGFSSMSIEVKSCSFMISNPEAIAHWIENGTRSNLPGNVNRLTEKAKEVLEVIESIVNNYKYDNSDMMVDYFDTNFYCHIQYCYDLKQNQDEQIEAAHKRGVKLKQKC